MYTDQVMCKTTAKTADKYITRTELTIKWLAIKSTGGSSNCKVSYTEQCNQGHSFYTQNDTFYMIVDNMHTVCVVREVVCNVYMCVCKGLIVLDRTINTQSVNYVMASHL